MGRILIVAEKPSVARDIARVVGCNKKNEGFLESDKYIVSWALGHLVALCEPEDYDMSYKKWSMDNLPIMPENMKLKAIKKTSKQLTLLKKLMNGKDIDYVICATDSGREGELIFRYIYQFVKCSKPFKRLWISSMTDEAIKEGLMNLKDSKEYDNLYLSAKCRSEADWLVGINASRAYTITHKALLSVGRVQTPTLYLIVKRQYEIDNFKSTDYYEVQTDYGSFSGIWFNEKYSNTHIDDIKKAEEIKTKVNKKQAVVTLVESENKKEYPPLLYDLTELQRAANRAFGYSAKKTLDIAQNLYEKHKIITYPRTDSRYITEDMKNTVAFTFKKLVSVDVYKNDISQLNLNALNFNKRIVDNSKVSDHHAIIPANNKPALNRLTNDEFNVYNLVVKRFTAVFYPPYEYNIKTVVAESQNESFVSKGKTDLNLGWRIIEPLKDKEEKTVIPPELKKGDCLNIVSAKVLKKKTQPPKQYTEATLLSAMENAGREIEDETLKEQMKDSGLGTPATRAAIIERLLSVGYIKRKGKSLVPEEKGKRLCMAVPEEIKSAETTGKWEKGLSSVSKGKMAPDRFMGSIKRFVMFLIDDAQKNKREVVFEAETPIKKHRNVSLGKCPVCGSKVLENSKAFYCSNWKEGCAFTVWKNILDRYGNNMDSAKMRKILKNGRAEKIKITMPQTGESGMADLVLNKERNYIVEIQNFERDKK